jgi:hypothetical protein
VHVAISLGILALALGLILAAALRARAARLRPPPPPAKPTGPTTHVMFLPSVSLTPGENENEWNALTVASFDGFTYADDEPAERLYLDKPVKATHSVMFTYTTPPREDEP